MSYVNYDDALNQIRDGGLLVESSKLSFDARIQRWKVDGEDREKRGWTKLREWTSKAGHTYIVGAYGVWRGNDDGYTKIELSKDSASALTDEDKAAIKAAHKEAERKLAEVRKAEIKKASQWAASVWGKCAPCEAHDYLTIKQIKPHGLRILPESVGEMTLAGIDDSNFFRLKSAAGALVVPMHDAKGVVQGLQFIYAKGHPRRIKIERDKEFWPSGMAMGGTFGQIGPVRRAGIMLIAEGYATAASLHECTGQTVAYAFSANNLIKAGKQLAKEYGGLHILFCADDDYLTDGNPGCTAAANACAEIERSAWIKPIFPKDEAGNDARNGKKLTDFNDLFVMSGTGITLAEQVNAKLDELKWKDTPSLASARGGVQPQGGGESNRPDALSIMPIDDIVARFMPIDDGSGKVLFDMRTKRIVQKTQMIELMPAGARGDDIKRHPDWISRGAVYVDQIGFDPSGKETQVKLNTWRGWPMEPKRGRCDMLLELLEYLCSREGYNPDLVKWVLCWMAYPLQHSGAKMQSAIILQGPQGTGKSTIFKVLAEIYGHLDSYQNYSVILDQKALEAKYNSDWDSKLFVLAEEVINSSDKWQLKNELKELVTGDRIRIEKKFLDAYYQTNRCNMVFLSNEDAPLPIDNDDRRHLVIWTPPPCSLDYYAQVREEISNGGVQAFYYYLMNLDLGDFKPWSRPPMTEAKQSMIDASRSSEDEFFHDWINGETPFPVCACRGDDLFSAYIMHCQKIRERNIASRRRFRIKLAHMHDWHHRKQIYIYDNYNHSGGTKQARLELPGESWLAKAIQKEDYRKKPEESQDVWATRCVLDFGQALKAAQEKDKSF